MITHGQRIRACLKQSEFAPVTVAGQITLLLALTAGYFDSLAIEQMNEAAQTVVDAAMKIPAEVSARFETASELSASDRETILEIARQSLAETAR